ncbi:MAG: T9SS type A sorting domain-containing protein, partial [Bacteroidales bacterium]|nr:T9SS type A sorting domain-containing protein [Bacteroidales bacterium]
TFTAGFAPNQYTVTAVPSDASMGSVTGSGTYNFGDTATLTATPNTGYGFRGWSDGNTSNPRSLIVTGDISLTANFSNDTSVITEYTVTLTVNDPAMGTLSTTGGTYAEGSTIVVTATANAGYHFVNWSDDNTDNPRTFIVNSDITLQANFAQDIDSTAVLTIVVEGNGYVTVNGTETSIFRGRLGDVVTLVAAPYEGAAFRGWSDGNTDATRSYTLTENNATLTASFGSVGIDAVTTASCVLYPNPAKGATTVSVTGISGKVHIAVLDLSGREVLGREFSILNSQFSISLDIEGLAEGAYFVRITSENNVPMVKRLIVR